MEGELAAGTPYEWHRSSHPAPAAPFRALDRLARVTIFFLTANVVLDLFGVFTDLQLVGLLDRVKAGEAVTFEEASSIDARMVRVGQLQAAGVLVTAIPFVLWFRRAYRNLGALGVRRLRFKPGWAVGGWFVPFLSLARPKSIANDIWRSTDPAAPPEMEGPPQGGRVSPLLNWWWAAFIASGILYATGGRLTRKSSIDEFLSLARRFVFADAISVAAGVLAVLVVLAVTARIQRRYSNWGAGASHEELGTTP